MSSQPPTPDPLLDAFWERGLILFGDRVQAEYGLRTPVFIDLRHKLYDDLDLLCELGRALHDKLRGIIAAESSSQIAPQQVIGIPDTATPIALSMALASRTTSFPLSYGQLRKQPADYPGGRSGSSSYMGTHDPRREITLIDDVMASGRTKRWALQQLQENKLRVTRILVAVDRQQGGDEIVKTAGCHLHSLYTVSSLIDYYEGIGKIDEAAARSAREHIQSKATQQPAPGEP
jgi:orotate phosphoribosyltransferase